MCTYTKYIIYVTAGFQTFDWFISSFKTGLVYMKSENVSISLCACSKNGPVPALNSLAPKAGQQSQFYLFIFFFMLLLPLLVHVCFCKLYSQLSSCTGCLYCSASFHANHAASMYSFHPIRATIQQVKSHLAAFEPFDLVRLVRPEACLRTDHVCNQFTAYTCTILEPKP